MQGFIPVISSALAFTLLAGCQSVKETSALNYEQETAVKVGRSSVAYSRIDDLCKLSEQDVVDVNNVLYHQHQIYFKGSPFYDYFKHGRDVAATSSMRDLEALLISEGGGSLIEGCGIIIAEVREISIRLGR